MDARLAQGGVQFRRDDRVHGLVLGLLPGLQAGVEGHSFGDTVWCGAVGRHSSSVDTWHAGGNTSKHLRSVQGRAHTMPVTDVAIDKIKEMIVSGELAPGDRLPKEAELAQRLGLSRSSLREAVKALCLIRVLDVRQGDGTYVTSLEPNLLLDAMTFVVDFHRDDTVLDFLVVRRILEPAATAMAALHMSDEDIAELGVLLGELE